MGARIGKRTGAALRALLRGVTHANLHREVDTGPAVGREAWGPLERRLESDPRFLRRIQQARASLRAGKGVRLEDMEV
jgi:hypothetical protein